MIPKSFFIELNIIEKIKLRFILLNCEIVSFHMLLFVIYMGYMKLIVYEYLNLVITQLDFMRREVLVSL